MHCTRPAVVRVVPNLKTSPAIHNYARYVETADILGQLPPGPKDSPCGAVTGSPSVRQDDPCAPAGRGAEEHLLRPGKPGRSGAVVRAHDGARAITWTDRDR